MKINADCIIILEGEKDEWIGTMNRIGTQKVEFAATLRSKNGDYQIKCIIAIPNAEGAALHFLNMT